jgi:outer membrane immunogenic protein
MRKLLLGTTAAAMLAMPALAADLRMAPVPVFKAAPPLDYFSGFYAGVNAGFGWGSDSIGVSGADPGSQNVLGFASSIGVPVGFNTNPSGFIGGGQAGYNFTYERFVVGVETDIDWSNIKGSAQWDNLGHQIAGLPSASSISINDRLLWLGTTRLRGGFELTPQWLVYATGGLAYGGVNTDVGFKFPPLQGGRSNSSTEVGWSAGAGTEYALSQNWLVRVEYLHYDLGAASFNLPVQATNFTAAVGTHEKGDIVRGGISYRF